MPRRIGFAPHHKHPWEGPLILEFTRHTTHSKTVRYRAAFQDRPFDVYVPRFILSCSIGEEAPQALQIAVDRSAQTIRTLGFGGDWRPLAAEPGVCEFAFAEEMINSKKYVARVANQVFSLYIPNGVFGVLPQPKRVYLRVFER
jgi:hypothetical protein